MIDDENNTAVLRLLLHRFFSTFLQSKGLFLLPNNQLLFGMTRSLSNCFVVIVMVLNNCFFIVVYRCVVNVKINDKELRELDF